MPPPKLALRFQWLPPILYKLYQNSISGYSKAPRGLSVLSRVTCIFTGTIISPSLWLRQCPNRYTFRAGRNLPDKEFRYLITVIVTPPFTGASVQSFAYANPLLNLPAPGRCHPYTSPYASQSCVFAKQSLGPIHCGFPLRKHPFSRSYGVILPSSLTRVLSHTLDSLLAYLCRFAVQAPFISLEAFLGSGESKTSLHKELPHHSSAFTISGFAYLSA